MFRSYQLAPHGRGAPLAFEWDADTGEFRGPDAALVRELCADAVRQGGLVGDPHPTFHEVRDPLHNATELAVVLASRFKLSEDLAAAYPPPPPDDLPPGAIA